MGYKNSELRYRISLIVRFCVIPLFLIAALFICYAMSKLPKEQIGLNIMTGILTTIPIALLSLLMIKITDIICGKFVNDTHRDIVDALKGDSYLISCLNDECKISLLRNLLGDGNNDTERGALLNSFVKYLKGEYNIRRNFNYDIFIRNDYPVGYHVAQKFREDIEKIISDHKKQGVWIRENLTYEKEYGNGQSLCFPLSISFLPDSEEIFSDILSSRYIPANKRSESMEQHLFREFFMISDSAWDMLMQNDGLRREFVKKIMHLEVKINNTVLDLNQASYIFDEAKNNLTINFNDDFVKEIRKSKKVSVSITTWVPIFFNRLFAAELCDLGFEPTISAHWAPDVEISTYPHWSETKDDIHVAPNGVSLTSNGETKWFFPPCGLILAIHGKKEPERS